MHHVLSNRKCSPPFEPLFQVQINECHVFTSYICVYRHLLHILCGYQCDKAVTKNDTREEI